MLEFAKDSYNKLCAPARFYLIVSRKNYTFQVMDATISGYVFIVLDLPSFALMTFLGLPILP